MESLPSPTASNVPSDACELCTGGNPDTHWFSVHPVHQPCKETRNLALAIAPLRELWDTWYENDEVITSAIRRLRDKCEPSIISVLETQGSDFLRELAQKASDEVHECLWNQLTLDDELVKPD